MSAGSTEFIIGVDGGGSGCRAAVAGVDGTLLGQGASGPANVATDAALAIANVRTAVRAALEAAGLDERALSRSAAHIGLAGMLSAPAADMVAREMRIAHCEVTDDRTIAVAGALGAREGVLLAIGTGTIIAAQRPDGLRCIGGWGLQVSDQASGAWLGRALLERVLLCHDGMALHSALTWATLAQFDGEATDIVGFAASAQPRDYAVHAPSILAAAAAGDPNARDLVQAGATFLSRALKSLGFGSDDVLCLSGGVGPHYAPYLDKAARDRIAAPAGTALDGALFLARAALGGAT